MINFEDSFGVVKFQSLYSCSDDQALDSWVLMHVAELSWQLMQKVSKADTECPIDIGSSIALHTM